MWLLLWFARIFCLRAPFSQDQGRRTDKPCTTNMNPELESLSIAASHQRRGIGSLLLDKWFSDVKIDEKEAPAFVVSSAYGKGLYEKYGWKEVKAIHVPLKDYGVEEGYTTWCMIREPKK